MSETRFTKDELKILIKIHNGTKIGQWYRREYSRLWGTEPLDIDTNEVTNLKIMVKRIINLMGFHNNEIYRDESFNLIDKLNNNINKIYGMGYCQEAVAMSIVTEVLDYYNAKYDDICNDINLNPNEHLNLKLYIHDWCKKNYWKPQIRISA